MNTQKKYVYGALLLSLLTRLATYPVADVKNPAFFEYGYIASNLLAGNGYSTPHWIDGITLTVPSAWMPPGQVLVTATFFALFGQGALSYHAFFLFNALVGTLAVYLFGRCSRLITGSRDIEVVTLYAAAIFPPFISASATWGIASSALLLNALLIYSALRLSRALSNDRELAKPTIFFGVVSGVVALFRAEAPLTVCFIMISLLIFHRVQIATAVKQLIVAGVLMLMLMAPWMIFNYSRFGEVVIGSTSGGFNLWRGNNPASTGGGWDAEGRILMPDNGLIKQIFPDPQHIDLLRFERDYSSTLATLSKTWIRENPGRASLLAIKKALLIWTADLYHPSKMKYVYGLFQVLALMLGIYGLVTLKRRGLNVEHRRWLWIAGAACLATTLLTMVFFSLPRYQMFLVGYYFPLVAIGLHAVLEKRGLPKDKVKPSLQG